MKYRPNVEENFGELIEIVKKFIKNTNQLIIELRNKDQEIERKNLLSTDTDINKIIYKERLSYLILADLIEQGWSINLSNTSNGQEIYLNTPNLESISANTDMEKKKYLQSLLLTKRNRQLTEPSVQDFITKMLKLRRHNGETVSILNIIDDGQDLMENIEFNGVEKEIDPYLEIITNSKQTDKYTGLYLNDIWRFFRHTWSLPYKTSVGRTLLFILRNKARKNSPVMGIGSLSNPVLNLKPRDQYLQWDLKNYLEDLTKDPSKWKKYKKLFIDSLKKAKEKIRYDDLIPNNLTDILQINSILDKKKDETEISKLKGLKKIYEKSQNNENNISLKKRLEQLTPLQASEEDLFVIKRCIQIKEVLNAEYIITNLDDNFTNIENLDSKIKDYANFSIRRALSIAVRFIKQNFLAANMLDLNVCGATAPYNDLLTGKLVALSVLSSDISKHYKNKYNNFPSDISSKIAGKEVIREPIIKFLTTSSLYGQVGSSQYNRLKISIGDKKYEWKNIGFSLGYGTAQFSKLTSDILRVFSELHLERKTITGTFGEGTSAHMRHIRSGLGYLGLDSDKLVFHSNKRVVYVLKLYPEVAHDFKFNNDRKFNLPSFKEISDFWMKRWLEKRVKRPDTIEKVKNVKKTYYLDTLSTPYNDKDQLNLNLFNNEKS